MRRPRLPSGTRRANALLKLLQHRPRALILTHDNPDPDAIGAALCLSHLIARAVGIEHLIVHGGAIGRAENRHMVQALAIPLSHVDQLKFRPDDALIMVDTQPGFGNNSLPPGRRALAVIDHHQGGPHPDVPHVDVRPDYGAACSMLTEYVVGAGLEMPSRLATAICHGIASETQDLGREAARADVAAFLTAFPASDQPLLGRLRHPPRDVSFFLQLDRAIRAARAADRVVVCHMGGIPNPDVPAEMADMLVSIEGMEWTMCTGVCDERLLVSLRTNRHEAHAGELLQSVIGPRGRAGGHGMIAGGSVPVAQEPGLAAIQADLTRSLLAALGRDPEVELAPLAGLADASAES